MLTFNQVNKVAFILLLVFILLKVMFAISFLWLIGLALVWFTCTVIGSFHIRWNYFLPALHHNYQVNEEVIAITFDDGIHPEYTPRVLDLLQKFNAKATFFVIGNRIEEHSEILKQIVSQGHSIGNHTFEHGNHYGFLKTKDVISDLKKTQALVFQLLGLEMLLYRPAFGVTNPRIARAVKALQLQAIGWSIRSLDTTKDSKETILNRITKNLRKGDVVLLHDTSEKTVAVLEQLLNLLVKRNMKSIPVDQLLKIKAYA